MRAALSFVVTVFGVACSGGAASDAALMPPTPSASTAGGPVTTLHGTTVDAYARVFTTQWGPTAFNASEPTDGYDDCGPTTLVMVLAARGRIAAPTATTAEDLIRAMRDLSHGGPTPRSAPTYSPAMVNALAKEGVSAEDLSAAVPRPTADALTAAVVAALHDGRTVLAAGDPARAWGRTLDARGAYLHRYDVVPDKDAFGHWVVVFDATADGARFVMADPLSSGGVVLVDREQLHTYFVDGASLSGAILVAR